MIRRLVLSAGLALAASVWSGTGNDAISLADKLLAAGDASQALDEIRSLRDQLAPEQRLTAWELDFGGEVLRVVHGRQYLYYQLHQANSNRDAPGRAAALKMIKANNSSSDWRFLVVCVAADTGQIQWSRGVNGLVNLAVDRETDTLYLFRERLLTVNPATGEIVKEVALPDGGRNIRGLLIGGELVIPQPHSARTVTPDARFAVYSTDAERVAEVSVAGHWLLAPDESVRLVPKGRGWDGVILPEGTVAWTLPGDFERYRQPLWLADGPVFITGTESERGTVTAVAADTGKVRWSTPLGFGTYVTYQHQLRGGGYQDSWRPLVVLDRHLVALDGTGQLVLLDPDTGGLVASARLHRDYLSMPTQHGEQLIVASFEWIRSYSLAGLIDPSGSLDAALQVREARCLQELGKTEDALVLLDRLLERAPQFEAGWAERGRVCQALHDPEEAAFSRVEALALSDSSVSSELRNSVGLLRLYDLAGRPCWSLAEANGRVYSGTLAGALWSVRTDTLAPELVKHVEHEIAWFESTTELRAVLNGSRGQRTPVPAPDDKRDEGIPNEWWTVGGGVGNAVCHQGRQFRAREGGGVRILDGHDVTDVGPVLSDVERWQIHLAPTGPVGYGAGVFELDADLRPVRWLVRPTVGGKKPDRVTIQFIACMAETFGLVVGSSAGAALQVYSRNGTLLNEAPLGRFISGWARPNQLLPLGAGYLFSDRQLVWVGTGQERPVWRFGPALSRTSTNRWGDRWRYFGAPLLSNGCLYVTGLHGHLYIFAPSSWWQLGIRAQKKDRR